MLSRLSPFAILQPPQDPPTFSSTSPHGQGRSPLDVPELLQLIFSFIDGRGLRTIILVCRQWFYLNQYRIFREVIFDRRWVHSSLPYTFARLVGAQRLVLYNTRENVTWNGSDLQVLFKAVQPPTLKPGSLVDLAVRSIIWIFSSSTPLQGFSQPIRELEIIFDDFKEDFFNTLAFPRTLTHLTITNYWEFKFDIARILIVCPLLESLRMSCHYPLAPRGPCTDRGSEAFPEQLRLRSLVIERLRLRQSWIENLLTCTPNLDTLKLIGTDKYYTDLRSDKWDWAQFRTRLQSLGLPRKHFHYSQFWHHVLDPEPLEADLTICPKSKERTFIYNDLTPQVIKFLWEQPVFLTTLELIMHEYTDCARDGWNLYRKKSFNARPLHQLLCESTNLRYLKTLKMPCIVEFMDIHRRDPLYPTLPEHQYDRNVTYDSDEHGEEGPSPLNIPGIWICRGLEILHLEFHVHNNANVKVTHHSRILYGYISSVCPRLRDLRVRFPHFCPSPRGGHSYKYQPYVLEGGLCLLSRLRYLERLCIWHGFTICERAELNWVARSGGAEHHRARRRAIVDGWVERLEEEAILETAHLQNNVAGAPHDILGPGAQDEKVMDGLKNLGLLQDVADMVAEMDTDEFVCLPEVYKVAFGMRLEQNPEKVMMSLFPDSTPAALKGWLTSWIPV